LINLWTGTVIAEQDLRPGIIDPQNVGKAGGSFPRYGGLDFPGARLCRERTRPRIG